MADFKTHITASTAAGIAYGYWGVAQQGMSLESGLLAGGLCSVCGMLPDLDSDSGVPLRETSMFAAAVVPMLMLDRFRDYELSHEAMALAAMLIYFAIRFILVEVVQTIHRTSGHVAQPSRCGLRGVDRLPCDALPERKHARLQKRCGSTRIYGPLDFGRDLGDRHRRISIKKILWDRTQVLRQRSDFECNDVREAGTTCLPGVGRPWHR